MSNKMATFEQSVTRLETILEQLSDNNTALDDSIQLYAEAAELIAVSHDILKKSEVKIREIDEKIETMRDEA